MFDVRLLEEPTKARLADLVAVFTCPECKKEGLIDEDQLCGRVSIDHTDTGCTFHQTIDLRPYLSSS